MKKKLIGLTALAAAVIIGLAACGGKNDSSENKGDNKTLVVGASPTPHAEILEHVKPLLKEEGIDLEIKNFSDYILPNKTLAQGDLDANYFQHIPYFNQQVKENNYDFVNAGKVHVELMGLYSKRINDIKDLEEGATVITSDSTSDWGRILVILQNADLIKLKDGVNEEEATFDDIAENPKKLKFVHNIDPSVLATTYNNDEADLVAINANFAFDNGLDPQKDALLLEEESTPYANIVAVRSEDKDNENIKKLLEVLHREEVQEWISEKWNNSVTPVE